MTMDEIDRVVSAAQVRQAVMSGCSHTVCSTEEYPAMRRRVTVDRVDLVFERRSVPWDSQALNP